MEDYELLMKGAEFWNGWRSERPDINKPYFFNAPLHYMYLEGANLQDTIFEEVGFQKAILANANLQRARIAGANFKDAILHRAILKEAKLQQVTFEGADLRWAIFEKANLEQVVFCSARLEEANFVDAMLRETNFLQANLHLANLEGADLSEAILYNSNLMNANLRNTCCRNAYLKTANLSGADLTNADLAGADLQGALLTDINVEQAILTGCKIYGSSAWNIRGTPKDQTNLVITHEDEPTVTVDDLRVAQFIYLLLNRENLRNIITNMTSTTVLILGRFSPERKEVLDALADEVRRYGLIPIIFDFNRVTSRDFTETIKILASLSFFVIADITKPKSIPKELEATIPDYKIPFVPVIKEGEAPFAMFRDLSTYDWVLPLLTYPSIQKLRQAFKPAIFERALKKHKEIQQRKVMDIQMLSVEDFL